MERRLGNDHAMKQSPVSMLVAALAAFVAVAPASAQNYGEPPLRYGNTSGPIFDGRDDHRDFPTDGFFPGNFAADPIYAAKSAEPLDFWRAIRNARPRPTRPKPTSGSRAIGPIAEIIVSMTR